MARDFIMPGHIISGPGALEQGGAGFASFGKKALIVTDKTMIDLGNCKKVEEVLQDHEIDYHIFWEVTGEPTDLMVEKALAAYKGQKCDFLIALGGGSAIDTMKAVASLAESGGEISDYMGKEIQADTPPMAAIPTTAGTGSEATQFTIITDTKKDIKMLLKGKVLMPDMAVIDARFTMTTPPKITAATGLDALCHGVEAYTSRKAQDMSDTFAFSAVKRIFRYLPIAYREGENQEAREQMALAALEAGIAFNNSSVTIIHGMSRPIGALFHVAHGLSNAMLLKECLSFALPGAWKRFGDLGRAVGAASETDTDQEAGRKFLAEVESLVQELDIPDLEGAGIQREKFFEVIDKMAHDAMESGSPQNTMRDVTEEQVKEIYKKLW